MTREDQLEATLHAMMRASPNTKIKQFYPMIRTVLGATTTKRTTLPGEATACPAKGTAPAEAQQKRR